MAHGKRTLVTGAAGFVGANLARRLVRDGHRVAAAVRPGGTRWRLDDIAGEVEFVHLNLTDRDAVSAAVERVRPEWVFHLAAHGAYSWESDFARIVETNLVTTGWLLEAALGAGFEAFVHTGSSSEYGFKTHAPSEHEATAPNSTYAVAKAAATAYCRHFAREHDVNVITLRLYSVYGPYEDPRRLVPTLIACGLKGELPPLVAADTARDFVFTSDVEEALVRAACGRVERGAVFNVGSGRQTTIADLVEIARQQLGIAAEPVWGSAAARIWDTRVWVADCTAIKRELGWQPQVGLAEGFALTAEWLKSHPEVWGVYGIEPAGSRPVAG
jgi:dolichol-phosphate mannosyltransferase